MNIALNETVTLFSTSKIPTPFGLFGVQCYKDINGIEIPVVKAAPVLKNPVLLRIHSSCITGDIFFSKRCDCREQLTKSMEMIAKEKNGLIIYLPQEGRGIGFGNKIKAYHYQDQGLDTYEANRRIGFADDSREYGLAVAILRLMEINQVKLITNNPEKVNALTDWGIDIIQRVPCEISPNLHNKKYLDAKKKKGHALNLTDSPCH